MRIYPWAENPACVFRVAGSNVFADGPQAKRPRAVGKNASRRVLHLLDADHAGELTDLHADCRRDGIAIEQFDLDFTVAILDYQAHPAAALTGVIESRAQAVEAGAFGQMNLKVRRRAADRIIEPLNAARRNPGHAALDLDASRNQQRNIGVEQLAARRQSLGKQGHFNGSAGVRKLDKSEAVAAGRAPLLATDDNAGKLDLRWNATSRHGAERRNRRHVMRGQMSFVGLKRVG